MSIVKKIAVFSALAGPVSFLTALLLIMFFFAAATGDSDDDDAGTAGSPVPVSCQIPTGTVTSLDAEQTANAAVIVQVGRERKVPEYGWVVALATALQESGLRNLSYGDRDSVGLFQQRPVSGWGTSQQLQTPRYAATAFYGGPDVPPDNAGLLDIPGWQDMPVTVAAQAVQRSGFPDAYADDEPTARAAVKALGGTGLVCADAPPPTTAAAQMVAVALAQVGKPYVWGGIGPDGFDCSGLIYYSWQQVGYLPGARVARDMHDIAVPIKASQVQPGDMIFSRFGDRGLPANDPGHIQLIVRPGTIVEALTTGTPVRVTTYDPADPELRFGRFPPTALTRTR